MQKEFNKLPIDKQRKFIIKNLLNDKHFVQFHEEFTNIYVENIFPKVKQKEFIKLRNNYINDKITKILRKYKDNIIDLHNFPYNNYFYDNALKQKNKLLKILNNDILNYKDEYNFTVRELIIDVWNHTKKILIIENLSLESIVNNIL
jgi:hypothetical protein